MAARLASKPGAGSAIAPGKTTIAPAHAAADRIETRSRANRNQRIAGAAPEHVGNDVAKACQRACHSAHAGALSGGRRRKRGSPRPADPRQLLTRV